MPRAPNLRSGGARCCSSTPTGTTARAGPRTICAPATKRRSPTPTGTFADVDGFAKVVTLNDLADNDFNCNIRRYADNSPPPEPHDVRAHLHGGVPTAEIERRQRPAETSRARRRHPVRRPRRRLRRLAPHRNVRRRTTHRAPGHQPRRRSTRRRQSMAQMVGRHRRTHAPPTTRPWLPRRPTPPTRGRT